MTKNTSNMLVHSSFKPNKNLRDTYILIPLVYGCNKLNLEILKSNKLNCILSKVTN